MEASYVDLADVSHLEFDYLRWIRALLRAARARHVLHVGGAGCALARALAAEDPAGRQDVCEVDAEVLELARAHLGLRRAPGLRVRHAEGRAHIAAQPTAEWDAIVIDAFVGATVPRRLITVQALAEVARVAPLAAVNIVDDHRGHDVRRVAAGLRRAYPRVWWIGGGRAGNTVVVGTRRSLRAGHLAAQLAADPSPARLTSPDAVARLVAGTPALHDGEL